MTSTFRAHPEGVEVQLGPGDKELLAGLIHVLESIGERGEDAAADRLAPPAYPADPRAQAEYARLVADEMNAARSSDRRVFASTLGEMRDRSVIDLEQAEAWVRVMGEARLVLAARLGIESGGWESRVGGDPAGGLLVYLGYLQEELVRLLSARLPG